MLHSAFFVAPNGTLTVSANEDEMPQNTWFTEMFSSPDMESIHLNIDPDANNLRMIGVRPTATRALLTETHIKALTNYDGMDAAIKEANTALHSITENNQGALTTMVWGAVVVNLDQVSPTQVPKGSSLTSANLFV